MSAVMVDNQDVLLMRYMVRYRNPELLGLLENIGKRPLTPTEREALRASLDAEYQDSGLSSDKRPNNKGLIINELMDRLAEF